MLGRFGRAQVCKTGASKGKTEVQAGQCSRCSGPLAGPACRRKNTRRPAQRKNACQKPAAVLCSKRKRRKGKVRQECAFAENFTQTCFTQWGLAPLFVLESGGCCRAFPFLGTAWNYAATCVSGPFCAQTRPSGTFCKGREVLLCRKFCCLQTI